MIVQISIDRVPENTEDEKELEAYPFGPGQTVANFDYDPKTGETWQYLYDLQETLFQMFRFEMTKAEKYQEEEDNKNE